MDQMYIKVYGHHSEHVCVCYLPPSGTSRNIIDVNDFYNTLLFQIYLYQNDGLFNVCGELNSKIGDSVDFIEGVDYVPEK